MLKGSELNNLLAEGYKSNIEILVQQRGSKLSRCVSNTRQSSKREIYETLSKVDATALNLASSRDGDTSIGSGSNRKRVILDLKTYEWADLIYREDKINSIGNPASVYAVNAAYALGRAKDKEIIESAIGDTTYLDTDGETQVPIESGHAINISSSVDFSIGELRKLRKLFNEKDIDPDDEQFIAVSGIEMSALLKEIQESKNIPFHESEVVQGLVEGRVKKFLGFTFKVISKSLLKTASTKRLIPAWSKSAVLLATGQDISVDIQRRPDRRNAVQVYASVECAAARLDQNGVFLLYVNKS